MCLFFFHKLWQHLDSDAQHWSHKYSNSTADELSTLPRISALMWFSLRSLSVAVFFLPLREHCASSSPLPKIACFAREIVRFLNAVLLVPVFSLSTCSTGLNRGGVCHIDYWSRMKWITCRWFCRSRWRLDRWSWNRRMNGGELRSRRRCEQGLFWSSWRLDRLSWNRRMTGGELGNKKRCEQGLFWSRMMCE